MRRLPLFLPFLLAAGLARAVPPIAGRPFPGGKPTCRVNKLAMAERMQTLLSVQRGARVLPPKFTIGTPKVLVIRVQFSGIPMTTSLPATQTLFGQVRSYYTEASYGMLVPTFTITNLYTLPQPLAYYGADCSGGADVACNTGKLFTDASTLALPDFGGVFTGFDQVMIYHAGEGQEAQSPGTNTDFIWSLYLDQNVSAGGKTFVGFTSVPESEGGVYSPHGVICHEYGHQQGLPDIYDTGTGKSAVGSWDIMDYPYGTTPFQTPHFGAWSKYFLTFSTPSSSTGTIVFSPAETTSTAFVRIPHPAANESFILEYRDQAAGTFDKVIPMSGLALWRIDETLTAAGGAYMMNNIVNAGSLNGTGHRGIDLIEADGIPPTPNTGDIGSGDLFGNGGVASGSFTDSFNGAPSGMTVVVVSGAGTPSLTANIVSFKASASFTIARLINYPNPGGDRSRYPVRAGAAPGTVTTLVMQFSKPLTSNAELSYDIYDMDGNLVRALPGSAFNLKAGAGEPTADGKWVYECDWDGRTDGGGDVASGVYVYRVKARGEMKTGKLVLIR